MALDQNCIHFHFLNCLIMSFYDEPKQRIGNLWRGRRKEVIQESEITIQ